MRRLRARGGLAAGLACALLGLNACQTTARAPLGPHEVLDEVSAATLIVVNRPIVFARARTDVAAHARDYVTLVGLQEDRSGEYSTWLIVHRWSTVDPRIADDRGVGAGELRIVADDRELVLRPQSPPPKVLERGDLLFAPKTARAQSAAYAVDVPTLRYLANSRSLALRFTEDALPLPYAIWADGRADLLAMLPAPATPRAPPATGQSAR